MEGCSLAGVAVMQLPHDSSQGSSLPLARNTTTEGGRTIENRRSRPTVAAGVEFVSGQFRSPLSAIYLAKGRSRPPLSFP
ncbi:Hypothetical predicted protein [Prunus dulcis]|uniref:Uncharacterized protein n=1 Tax=Prunus dulcis TaxID=3755 RepID=A0A5E4G888_PRUDU|nr:Hypothetical predicted protein [Prunus dulcis]